MTYIIIAGRDNNINLPATVANCIRVIMRLLSNRWSRLLQRLTVSRGIRAPKLILVDVTYLR
jgi:hypothetical protein